MGTINMAVSKSLSTLIWSNHTLSAIIIIMIITIIIIIIML